MYDYEKISNIFKTNFLNAENYQSLLTNLKSDNHAEGLIDYYFQHISTLFDSSLSQLFCDKAEQTSCSAEFQYILNELHPVIVLKTYLYICQSLVEPYLIHDINKLFAQYCNQYTLNDLDKIREQLKDAKKEFFNRVATYEDPHGINPYYLFKNFTQTRGTDEPPKGLILEGLMDYLHESIQFDIVQQPVTISSLFPEIHLIFVKNYSLLPGHGNRKNNFSFNDLIFIEDELNRVQKNEELSATIKCRKTELLCETLIDEIIPFARIRNTLGIYLCNHYDFKAEQLADPGYAFLSLYYIIMNLPTIPLQDHFATILKQLIQNNDTHQTQDSSNLIFEFWEKISNLSKVIYPLGIVYLSEFLWDTAEQHCKDASDNKSKLIYVKTLLENYIEKNELQIFTDKGEVPTFEQLDNLFVTKKQLKVATNIIYKLLSPYDHTFKNLWGLGGHLENRKIPCSEIYQKIYFQHSKG